MKRAEMIPEEATAAVERAVRKAMEQRTYDRHAYNDEVFSEGVTDIAQAALEAAAPFLRAQALLGAAKEARVRGDIGKDGGLESWDYLEWRANKEREEA